MFSAIPDKTKLFLLTYCTQRIEFCFKVTTLFSKVLHFSRSFSFSSYNRLIKISVRLPISSFKLLVQLIIFSSNLTLVDQIIRSTVVFRYTLMPVFSIAAPEIHLGSRQLPRVLPRQTVF